MAERLTEYKTTKGITRIVIKPYVEMSEEFQPVADKLCAFEDILEKYGIESVEVIDGILEKYFSDTWITVTPKIMKNWELISDIIASDKLSRDFELGIARDRDTWKRACELACENMKLPVDILIGNKEFNECHSIVEYFYQQAKKEGENNDTNQ